MGIDSLKALWKFDTIVQNEALINELKGALFEYLVAEELSKLAHPKCSCLISTDLRDRLLHYESWLRGYDLGLIVFMPQVAKELARAIKEHLPEQLTSVDVVGKLAGGSGQKDLHESDVVVHTLNQQGRPQDFFIGLKLCKANSFVNTKSGGAQTFLARYFASFNESTTFQQEMNLEMERAYSMMGQNLYEETGLAVQGHDFKGYFGTEWLQAGFPELPGQLDGHANEIVLQYYHMAISTLHRKMLELSQKAPNIFAECLYPLVGFGARNLIQAIVFVDSKYHSSGEEDKNKEDKKDKKKYTLSSFKIHTEKDVMDELSCLQMVPLQTKISSFEILLKSWRLQIRMKPMNKFTVPGLKVNCSVKYASSL